jgi:translation initiation factor IF-3
MAYNRKPREPQLYVNNQIKAPFIILVDEEGKQLGKFPRRKMFEISEEK